MTQSLWFMLLGVVMAVLSIPLLLRRIPPNPIYGLRVPATFRDEQVWYDANAASARDLLWLGIGIALLAVVLPVVGVRDMAFVITWAGVAGAGSLVVTVLGWTRANRMLRERHPSDH